MELSYKSTARFSYQRMEGCHYFKTISIGIDDRSKVSQGNQDLGKSYRIRALLITSFGLSSKAVPMRQKQVKTKDLFCQW
jgi:hypothetical protein